MIALTLHSTASSRSVLAALQAHAGEWRESQIPDDLRRVGILGIECTIHESVCRLRYSPNSSRYRLLLELTATVAANPTGGTLVGVCVRYRPYSYAAMIPLALFGAGGAWLFAATSLAVAPPLMAGGLLGLHLLHVREANAALLRRERQPAYLIERLERAVAAAGTVGIGASAS